MATNHQSSGPTRLYLLQSGAGEVPTPNGGTMDMTAGCYLVQTDAGNVLVDTGPPAGMEMPGGVRSVVDHLAALGLAPSDIAMVISTHFDLDHAGMHEAFPDAEHVVQRLHWDTAQAGDERLGRAREHWGREGLRYRIVDGDVELMPGLELIETSGHVPGHQSVLVRLPQTGPVLLAIDAAPIEVMFGPERPQFPMDTDHEQARASSAKLHQLAQRENVALVVFHHDGAQWRNLKLAPDWYE